MCDISVPLLLSLTVPQHPHGPVVGFIIALADSFLITKLSRMLEGSMKSSPPSLILHVLVPFREREVAEEG